MMSFKTLGMSFFLLFITIFSSQLYALSEASKISITTFNIRMFGYRNDSDIRDLELQTFINEQILTSDVLILEEIMDVPRFKKLLPAGWSCITYDHSTPHQFVLLCHSSQLNFLHEPTDDNDIIDEVGGVKRTLRPAVTAIVTDQKNNVLFRIVAVHLKALPDFSQVRIQQAEEISLYLKKVKDPTIPIIITGDFNTYTTAQNGQLENDTTLISNKFKEHDLDLQYVPNNFYTFRTNLGQSQFDQFYISRSIKVLNPLKVFSICNDEIPAKDPLTLDYYNKIISDHCPVTLEIGI